MRVLRAAATLSLALAAAFPAITTAHAQLLSSTPAADATISSLPASFLLVYDDNLRSDSSFVVLGPAGLTVATGAVDPTSVKSMTAPMPSLADGNYEVHYTAISSDDGFIERGSFKFKVATATSQPSVAGTAGASTSPSAATPAPSAGPDPGASGTTGDVLIPIAVVGILVGVGLGWFMRRRRAA